MVKTKKRIWCIAVAVLAAVTGCGTSDSTAPAASTSAAATPTTQPSATQPSATQPSSTITPSPSKSTPPSSRPHTGAELKAARLSLTDLPAGFELEKAAGDDGASMSSNKPACAPLVRIMNAAKLPGSKAQAAVSFSGGQEGPFIDENLDVMGTKGAAGAVIDSYRKAVKACPSVTVRLSGAGASKVDVREISFGTIGDKTFGARFRATGGELEGLEILQVGVQSGDVVVGMTFVGLDGPDAEAATADAVDKVEQELGTSEPI